jgi:acetyltransferase-like isoleucine patch superfamily enzyme
MKSYFFSLFSLKKFTHKNVSLFAYWDRKSIFSKDSEIRHFAKMKNSSVGKYSRLNPDCKLANTSVGNFTAIGRNTTCGLGRHPLNFISTQNIFYKKNKMNNRWVMPIHLPSLPITIGNDVWIGVEALVLDGVTIGDGAVIGARSVVTKDIPPYAIAVGSPAKIIKYRFDPEVIERLLEINWWNFTDAELDKNIRFFREENVTIAMLNKYFPK